MPDPFIVPEGSLVWFPFDYFALLTVAVGQSDTHIWLKFPDGGEVALPAEDVYWHCRPAGPYPHALTREWAEAILNS